MPPHDFALRNYILNIKISSLPQSVKRPTVLLRRTSEPFGRVVPDLPGFVRARWLFETGRDRRVQEIREIRFEAKGRE
jgi:hypothetical protein